MLSTTFSESRSEDVELCFQTLKAEEEKNKSVTLTWDRPHGRRANVKIGMSDINLIVVPELFRDLGLVTTPVFPT